MKFLFWLYSIAALAFYGWFVVHTVGQFGTESFNIFVTYLVTFVVSFVDYIGIHRMTRSMFGKSIVLAIPDFLHDYVTDSAVAAIIMLVVLFLVAPIIMLLCIIFHIVGMVKTFTTDYDDYE